MAESKNVQELRAELAAVAFGESADEFRTDTPFNEEAYRRFLKLLTGNEPNEDASSLKVQGDLLREIGFDVDWEERGSGPLLKHELDTLADELSSDDGDDAWGPVGSVDRDEQETEDRSLQTVDPSESPQRYKALIALARFGPDTASNVGEEVEKNDVIQDLDWSTVESELPRLFKMRMAERSKQPGFGDVYTYWLSDGGESLLVSNGNLAAEDISEKHREYRRVFRGE